HAQSHVGRATPRIIGGEDLQISSVRITARGVVDEPLAAEGRGGVGAGEIDRDRTGQSNRCLTGDRGATEAIDARAERDVIATAAAKCPRRAVEWSAGPVTARARARDTAV